MDFDLDYDIEYLLQVTEYNSLKYNCYKNDIDFELNPEYEKVLKARYNKVGRIKRRLVYLFSRYKYIWFCTFTFDDDLITKCTRTKRDVIKKCISQKDFKYILNIDFGSTTEREHYHCILATDLDIDINLYFKDLYPCFSLSILCKNGINDFQRLSKYINKLVNHCVKATTKRQRILYNFKGLDSLSKTTSDITHAYHLLYSKLEKNSGLQLE